MSDDGRWFTLGAIGVAAVVVVGSVVRRPPVTVGETVMSRHGIVFQVEALDGHLVRLRRMSSSSSGSPVLWIPQQMIRGGRIEPGDVFAYEILGCSACGATMDPGEPLLVHALQKSAVEAGWSIGGDGSSCYCPACTGRRVG